MRRVQPCTVGRIAGTLAGLVIGLLGATLTGCGTDPSGRLTLAVNDQNLRTPGAECSGGNSLMYLHAGATYRIVDDAQRTLLSGTLPAGTAEPALDVDYGKAVRIPTVCTMQIVLDPVPADEAAWLIVAGGKPIALRGAGQAGTWVAQIPEPAAEWSPSAPGSGADVTAVGSG